MMENVTMNKGRKLRGILLALLLGSLVLTGCASKNDKDMYESYTKAIVDISEDTLTLFANKLQILAESIPLATTPLERHLIRESILDLQYDIQKVQKATGGNDVLNSLAVQSNNLLWTIGKGVLGYKGIETLGKIVDSAGSITASEGSSVSVSKPENHITTVGDDNVATSKEPVIVEVPTEIVEDMEAD